MGMLRRLFLHSPGHWIASALVGALVTAAGLAGSGSLARWAWTDALSAGGCVSVLLGLLILVTRFGAFDIFGYAFSALSSQRRSKTLYDYSRVRAEKRGREPWTFMPWIAVGVLLVLVSLIFRFL